jgi:spore coat protein U-like protein
MSGWLICSLVVCLSPLAVSPAQAQCNITATNVAFANVDVISGSPDTTTGTVTINCPAGLGSFPYLWACVSIGVGTNSTSVNARTMKSGANTLSYQLYSDSGYGTVFTYTSPYQYAIPYNNSTGAVSSTTVYARVPAGQTSPPGAYTDTYSTIAQAQVSGSATTTLPGSCSGASFGFSFSVTATVQPNCSVSVADVNFGSTATLGANIDASGTVTAQCTNTTPYNIGLSAGVGTGASVTTRKMTSGAKTVNYSLYRDVGRSAVWGTTIGTNTVSATGTGSAQNTTVYGRVPPQTVPGAGTFTDTVVVTVTY